MIKRPFLKVFVFLSLLALLWATAINASEWTDTEPAINATHIFYGEINRRGKPVGFHARQEGDDPATAKVVRISAGPNQAGVYTADVEIWDSREKKWKRKFSTFFPDDLTREEVIESILKAHRDRATAGGKRWEGPSGRGFRIQGYYTNDGRINTAYPIYERDGAAAP